MRVLFNKLIVIGILILFVGAGIIPIISGNNNDNELSSLTFYSYGKTGTRKCEVELPIVVVEDISVLFESVKKGITSDPFSVETESLKNDFVEVLYLYNVIPRGLSKDDVLSLLKPRWNGNSGDNGPFVNGRGPLFGNSVLPGPFAHTGSSFFCSMAGGGSGVLFAPVMMPRPRFATVWSAYLDDTISIASNLYTGHGFAAMGSQLGVALGFWGIGLSFAVPGEPAIFGFGGYALAAFVGADEIDTYPPNQVPIISEEHPSDGAVDVPVSLSELSFRISDGDGDRMSYSVSTDPDIGSGDGSNVVGGTYSIPVSGLNSDTLYSWHVVVSDAEDVSEETFSFRTAKEAPFVSDPIPVDGDDWVSVNLSEISFRLEDFQGDLMDFSVETVPDIGSGSGSGVGDGVYSVDVGGLKATREYSWFVNVTDGEFWTRRVFNFKTQPLMVFDPFEEDWSYRKMITVNCSMVDGDLSGFPVLVSLVDSDLAVKAQVDGDDILFMDGSGVANRLYHEIERYDGSSGELIAWVNVASLSSVNDTVLYLYYGNVLCSSQEFGERVWDSDFLTVLHMNDPSGNPYDSTKNHETWQVKNGGTLTYHANGQVGYAIKGEYAENDGNRFDNFGMDWTDLTAVTTEWWFAPDDITIQNFRFGADGKNTEDIRNCFKYNSETQNCGWAETWDDGTVRHLDGRFFNWNNGEFHHGAAIMDNAGSNYQGLYTDGALTVSANPSDFNFANLNNQFYIGSRSPERGKDYNFDGWLDEFRISKVRRSDAWISTSYNTMNDPSNFFCVGIEESSP